MVAEAFCVQMVGQLGRVLGLIGWFQAVIVVTATTSFIPDFVSDIIYRLGPGRAAGRPGRRTTITLSEPRPPLLSLRISPSQQEHLYLSRSLPFLLSVFPLLYESGSLTGSASVPVSAAAARLSLPEALPVSLQS